MSKLKQINKLAMEIVNDETESYRLADMNAQRIVILTQPIQLNEDQQTVLNGLKEFHAVNHSSIATLYELHKKNMQTDSKTVEIWKAYRELSSFEGFQVMQAFAEWGLSNETL